MHFSTFLLLVFRSPLTTRKKETRLSVCELAGIEHGSVKRSPNDRWSSFEKFPLTLAPIWLPHWPACKCTISLILYEVDLFSFYRRFVRIHVKCWNFRYLDSPVKILQSSLRGFQLNFTCFSFRITLPFGLISIYVCMDMLLVYPARKANPG